MQAKMAAPSTSTFGSSAANGFSESPMDHGDPRFHCRPKTSTGASRKSPTRPHFFKCDANFECDVWPEGEEESGRLQSKHCEKNPGHVKFYSAKEFSSEKLPLGYRSPTYEKGIKSVSDLTVRIQVKYTSKGRPDDDYFAKYRGTRVTRNGSGFIHSRLFLNKVLREELRDDFTGTVREDSGLEDDLLTKYEHQFHRNGCKFLLQNAFPQLRENETFEGAMTQLSQTLTVIQGFSDFVADYNTLYKSGDFGGEYDENEDVNNLYHKEWIKKIMWGCEKKDSYGRFFYRMMWPSETKEEKDCRHLKRLKDREPLIELMSTILGISQQENAGDGDNEDQINDCDNGDKIYDNGIDHKKYEDGNGHKNVQDRAETERQPDVDQPDETDDEDKREEQEIYGFSDVFQTVAPCPCQTCKVLLEPKPTGYLVHVLTAQHVVHDKEEAQHTVVHLFYDDENKNGMKQLDGVNVYVYEGDYAVVVCATHDESLIKKLQEMTDTRKKMLEKMKAKSESPLTVICSHPHGRIKHITVGKWTSRKIYERRDRPRPLCTSYFYDTPTCPGSSGAPVLLLGHKSGTLFLDSLLHPHHGHEREELNKSCRLISYDRGLSDKNSKVMQKALREQEQCIKQINKEIEQKQREEAIKLTNIAEAAEKFAKTNWFLDLLKKIP